MKIIMTVTNRPHYLKQVLDSWANVRGVENAEFAFACEPTDQLAENLKLLDEFAGKAKPKDVFAHINETVLGVSRNPYTALKREFDSGEQYVIATEDDLVVSSDILEYHAWGATEYINDDEITAICSFTHIDGCRGQVVRTAWFSPWVWGTWADRWDEYVGVEWDVNEAFYTDFPGHEVGWDWHLEKRLMRPRNKKCIFPLASRSNSIGIFGVHSYAEIHHPSTSFMLDRPTQTLEEAPPDI